MPAQEFSYDRDIGAYASKFFDTIGNDPRLSSERKTQLQGTLLGGVQDIEAQRLKLQEEREKGTMRSLDVRKYQSDLEDARAKRIKMQQQAEAVNGAKTRVNGILADPNLTPEQKRQMLAVEELNHPLAGDQNLGKVFNLGREALPKDQEQMFTPSQQVEFLSKVANSARPEDAIAALRDPAAMAQLKAAAEAQEKEDKEADNLRERKDADAHEIKKGMTRTRFKFGVDEDGMPSGKLDDESSRNAELVVRALAPSEMKKFTELKSAGDHQAVVQFVEGIQDRQFDEMLGGKKGDPDDISKSKLNAKSVVWKKRE